VKPAFDPQPFEVCVYRVTADDRVETQVVRSLDDLGSALADGWSTTVDAARQVAATRRQEAIEAPEAIEAAESTDSPDHDDAPDPADAKPKKKASKKK
jgi:hypothetical protein